MAKKRRKKKDRPQKRRRDPKPPRKPKPKPEGPKLTLPPMTVQGFKKLNEALDQRRVCIQFRDSEPDSIIVKVRNDPNDMQLTLGSNKYEPKLRVILANMVRDIEDKLADMGIDLSELEDYEAPGDGGEEGYDGGADDELERSRKDARLLLTYHYAKGFILEDEYDRRVDIVLNAEDVETVHAAQDMGDGPAEPEEPEEPEDPEDPDAEDPEAEEGDPEGDEDDPPTAPEEGDPQDPESDDTDPEDPPDDD